ncbi:MAG: hypothetical protein JJ975_09000 [Bacteroidia bacterium]|nr:hypothetical protein [Bacteroidia bacterium]
MIKVMPALKTSKNIMAWSGDCEDEDNVLHIKTVGHPFEQEVIPRPWIPL